MDLKEFITGIQSFGVVVPGYDHWREARDLPGQLPDDAGPLLGRSPAELLAFAERRALVRLLNHPRFGDFAQVCNETQRAIDDEFRRHLAAEVDRFILELRPAFDAAADAARSVVTLGVSPEATVESLFDAPEAQRTAWREFTTRHVQTLAKVFSLRRAMSTIFGVPPQRLESPILGTRPADVEWSVAITRPSRAAELPHFPADATASPKPWLRIAQSLYLPTTSELDGGNLAAAVGLPVHELASIARERIRAGVPGDIPATLPPGSLEVDLSGTATTKE